MICLTQASVTVPDGESERTILHPTTLAFAEHRIGLIGANGSGKSTLARLLNGLVEPSSGSVTIDALDTRRDGAAVRSQVGFVFTNPQAQLVMPTVIEDVALSLRRTIKNRSQRMAAARDALARFGLADLAERSVHSLSGGQQQLLAIASVLATNPRVLVADEPTTLLDLRNSRLVSQLLLGLPQQLVVVTHDLELAAKCDRVLVIESGSIARDSAKLTVGERTAGRTAGRTADRPDNRSAVADTIEWYRSTA